MRCNQLVLVCSMVALGCDAEGRSRPGDSRETAAAPAAGGYHFEMTPDTGAPPAPHASFDSRREQVAPGVSRVTVSLVVRLTDGRQAVRSAMQRAVEEQSGNDSTVAAVRVTAYGAPAPAGARQAPLVEVATMEWAPLSGWDALDSTSRAAFHRTNTVFLVDLPDTPMPPAHPAPRRN